MVIFATDNLRQKSLSECGPEGDNFGLAGSLACKNFKKVILKAFGNPGDKTLNVNIT